MIDSRDTILSIFDTHAPPDVIRRCVGSKFRLQQPAHSLRSFRQHLIDVPIRSNHHAHHPFDVVVTDIFVEKVAHRIHEDVPRAAPTQRFLQFLRDETQIESLLVRMTVNSAKTLCERCRVTVLASRADLRAATHRIPGRISPFDIAVFTHRCPYPLFLYPLKMSSAIPDPVWFGPAKNR